MWCLFFEGGGGSILNQIIHTNSNAAATPVNVTTTSHTTKWSEGTPVNIVLNYSVGTLINLMLSHFVKSFCFRVKKRDLIQVIRYRKKISGHHKIYTIQWNLYLKTMHPRDQQACGPYTQVVFICSSIACGVYPWGIEECGLYKQVVFRAGLTISITSMWPTWTTWFFTKYSVGIGWIVNIKIKQCSRHFNLLQACMFVSPSSNVSHITQHR